MDAAEDLVGFPIPAPPFPPTFNHSEVVSKDSEVLGGLACGTESASKKFEANSFCPSDIPALGLPSWDETPSSPFAADNNADTNT